MTKRPMPKPPFFEVGPKAYLYGEDALNLALAAEEASLKTGVDVIFTPQAVDIWPVSQKTKRLFICAQHMDALLPGKGQGSILPEAVRAAGASCVMLNHAERPLALADIRATVQRAQAVGLFSIVCADSIAEARAVSMFSPTIVVVEPTELIGSGVSSDDVLVRTSTQAVKDIDPGILVLQGAGISSAEDVYRVIYAGADATGSSSAICKAADPGKMLLDMLSAARQAYDDRRK
jgi:triosephosphate isomerase